MKVRHVLSVEIEDFKRNFIVNAHTLPGETPEYCLFDDVAVMDADSAYCYTCKRKHSTQIACDVLFSGPSCKNISYENPKMSQWASCYDDGTGCSGHTYKYGFKKSIEIVNPAVAFFENTKGVADQVKDSTGKKQRPRIQAVVYKKVFMCVGSCQFSC